GPLVVGPKPAITRPFAGHRSKGASVAGLAPGDDGGASSTGAIVCAVCGGRDCCSVACATPIVDGLAAADFCSSADLSAGARAGITSRSPTLSVACGSMLLALAPSVTERL